MAQCSSDLCPAECFSADSSTANDSTADASAAKISTAGLSTVEYTPTYLSTAESSLTDLSKLDLPTVDSAPAMVSQSTFLTRTLALSPVDHATLYHAYEGHYPSQSHIDGNDKWISIGSGQCGTVYRYGQDMTVIKRANSNHPSIKAWLWNDFIRQHKIHKSFHESGVVDCRIPKARGFRNQDSNFWSEQEPYFEDKTAASPTWAILAERIPPVPRAVQHALIEHFCPAQIRPGAHASPANRACLIRLYLGRRRQPSARPSQFFSLRNFGLTIDMMRALNLPWKRYLDAMTQALAAMHFVARVDARDVESVLGAEPTGISDELTDDQLGGLEPGTEVGWKDCGRKRVVGVWCLDFNQVGDLTMDEVGMRRAAEALAVNDPYFPRPHVDGEAWGVFRERYVYYACELRARRPEDIPDGLPGIFIDSLEERWRSS